MPTIVIPKVRKETDVMMYVKLTDNGVTVDWTSLSEVVAFMYSNEQDCIAGQCETAIAAGDPSTLNVRYTTMAPQFLGVNSLLIRCTYDGMQKSFDVPVLEFVDRTAEATGQVTLDDPELPVSIEVTDVDTSLLDEAIAAALDAAAAAAAAAALVPLDVLTQCQEATIACQDATAHASPIIGENGNWKYYDAETGEYVDSEKPSRGIQGPQGKQGPQGIQGNTGSSVDYPFELVNNRNTDDPEAGLTAAEGKRLGDDIGDNSYTFERTVSDTFSTANFGTRLTVTGLTAKKDDLVKVVIGGTSVRSTQRLYVNTSGGSQITIPGSGSVIVEFKAAVDITALYFAAAVTTGGTIEMTVSYAVGATGLRKSEDQLNSFLPNLENIVGVVKEQTTTEHPTWSLTSAGNRVIYDSVIKNDNCAVTCKITNLVGSYSTVRLKYGSGTADYFTLAQISEGTYYGEKSLVGVKKGAPLQVLLFTDSTHSGSASGACDLQVTELSRTGTALIRVDIYKTDTQAEIYEKMQRANNIRYCDVHFEPGTYNFTETLFDYILQEKGTLPAELPIGGNCVYHFNGATLVGSYAGSNDSVRNQCNVLGCRRTAGNFELHDGTIIANDIVYGIHDDVGDNLGDVHIHKYSNMHVIYNGSTYAQDHALCKCIGGGTGKNLTVIIDKCILEKYTENSDKNCVTYHGLSNNPSYTTKARIMITNTWMNGYCRAYHLVASNRNEEIEFIVSNSHLGLGTNDVDNFFSWNNEPLSQS